ncbi:hypothetical protein CHS0354_037092 [Potamilus streckersoni]|uniref:Uncharacterized protein n=1 Tax=Potamilus streckersoni TaxID=2493646 RepID=A0AAE0RPD5_9BIVA|nr:hypothetical protein CHS0354_037092 [Potamilus streckersoni]
MATGKATASTRSEANDSSTQRSAQEESQDVPDSKKNEKPRQRTSTDEVMSPTEEEKLKPDAFSEWCEKVVSGFEEIKDPKKLVALKEQVIQVEEKFESVMEGYQIESRLQETEKAIKTLEERLNISNENSRNMQTTRSVSQESVLQRFEELYAQWNKKWSHTDHESDLCKIHEECYQFCKKWFKGQMKKLLEVGRPQSKNQSYKDNDEQIIQEAYKELARNTVGTDLQKVKVEGSKTIKTDKEFKKVVPECIEICWITLILKEPMSFEFDCQHAKEGTFEGTTQDKMAIVIKPALLLDKDTITIRGMVRQRQDDVN